MLRLEKLLVNSRWSKKRGIKLAQKLLGFVELNGEVEFLEVGCGSGEVARYIARNYRGSVVGADVDPEQIGIAQKNVKGITNVQFLEADSTGLPFEDSSFDVVLSFGVLHHIDKWLDAISEIKRVLRPGGYFIYADLIYPRAVTRMDSSSKYSFGLATVNVDEVDSFLGQNGFEKTYYKMEKSFVCHNYEAVYRKS